MYSRLFADNNVPYRSDTCPCGYLNDNVLINPKKRRRDFLPYSSVRALKKGRVEYNRDTAKI